MKSVYFSTYIVVIVQLIICEINGQGLLGGLLGGGNKNKNTGNSGNSGNDNNKGGVNLNVGLLGLPVNLNLGGGTGNKKSSSNSELEPNRNDNCRPPNDKNRPCPPDNFLRNIGLAWDLQHYNSSGVFIPPQNPNSREAPRFYYLGYQQANINYGNCKTPKDTRGKCRHIEHCVLKDFQNDYQKFLQYACIIEGSYIGTCCPKKKRPEPFPSFNQTDSTTTPTTTSSTTKDYDIEVIYHTEYIDIEPSTSKPKFPPFKLPNRDRPCGVSEKQISRVVGGRKADPKAWPWMAALLRTENLAESRAGQYCGGVLISEYFVLTASHCVDGFEPSELRIRLGEYDFTRVNDSIAADFEVEFIKMHKGYNRYTYKNDIAIVKLSKSAYFNDKIRPICLPPLSKNFTNEIGIVTGWGTIFYGGPHSETLMEVLVPVWDLNDCKKAYVQPIEETNLCAGVRSGGQDSCQGDSGGPLQVQVRGKWTTIGIVSWGIRCAEPGYPGVYTAVSDKSYIDFIRQIITS